MINNFIENIERKAYQSIYGVINYLSFAHTETKVLDWKYIALVNELVL